MDNQRNKEERPKIDETGNIKTNDNDNTGGNKTNSGNKTGNHKLSKIIRNGALIVWGILLVWVVFNRDKMSVDAILNYTPANVGVAMLVILGLFALKTMSVFFYSGAISAASGMIFDLPLAIVINLLGAIIMITEGYLIGKFIGGDQIHNLSEKHPKLQPLLDLQEDRPFAFAFLIRLMKVINFDLGSMYMGASGTRFLPCAVASILGMAPEIVIYPIIGDGISTMDKGNLIVAGIVYGCITVAAFLLLRYLVRHPKNA